MTFEDAATALDGADYDHVYDERYFEQLAEEGVVLVYAGPEHKVELHGAIEAEVPLGRFGLMANGEVRPDGDRADCFITARRTPTAPARVTISADLACAQFTILDDGKPLCRGLAFDRSDLIRRGGVVFERTENGLGSVFFRGILLRRNVTPLTASRMAADRKVPLLLGRLRRGAGRPIRTGPDPDLR